MLSVIVITRNEEQHIARCLASVAWADEIIVLDSGSSDNTVAVCKQFSEQVFETDWPGFGPQKQRALAKASHDWVLSLDADEEVSSELMTEIQDAMQQVDVQGFYMPRLSSYCGKTIKHGGWWPDYVLRLFRRDCSQFSEDVVHERVIVTGTVKRLVKPLWHEAFTDPTEVLHKINSYSSLGAAKLYSQHQQTNLAKAIGHGIWTFIRTYFLKAGFLDGAEGLMLAISNAEGSYYKYLKLRDLCRNTLPK